MAWQLTLALLAAQWFRQRFLTPKPPQEKQRAADLGALARSLYKVGEGDPVPLIYGTARVPGQVVWAGSFLAESNPAGPPSPPGTVVNYRYRAALQMVFGLGNARVTTGRGASFRNMYVGDKRIGVNSTGDPEVFTIQANDFYGGLYHGGGINGRMIFQRGTWSQVPHPAWVGDRTLLPAYRGQICAGFVGAEGTGILLGEEPRIEPWHLEVFNPVGIPGQLAGLSAIGGGDVNPASVIHDLLTNPWGRGQLDETEVDVASFVAAATTFEQEEHGISIVFSGASELSDCIKEVERQTDGTIYVDPISGKYKLRLIRDDYDVANLPVFGPSDVVENEAPQISSSTWEETFNEVRVIYNDREQRYTDRVALAQDLAVIAAQGGRRRSKELRFPGVSNRRLAARLAARELNLVSRPLVRLRVSLKRTALRLTRGAPFVFHWPELDGFSMVFRVGEIDYGRLDDGRITVDAIQDRFAVSWSVYDPGGVVVLPFPVPEPVRDRVVTEAPRWLQRKAFEAGIGNDPEVQRGFYLARRSGDNLRYRVHTSVNASARSIDMDARSFPPTAELGADYARTLDPYDTTTGLVLSGLAGVTVADLVAAPATEDQVAQEGRNLGYCGGEILSWERAIDLGGGVLRLENVGRGRVDTVPVRHAERDVFYFLAPPGEGAFLGRGGLSFGAVVQALIQGGTGLAWADEELSPVDELTVRARALLPYPPANLFIDGTKTRAPLEEGSISVSWRARDRRKPTLTRGDAVGEALEPGMTFAIVGSKDSGTPVEVETGLTAGTMGVLLGKVGHGLMDIGVEARRPVTLPTGATPMLGSWQTPSLPVLAHHWRNLLRNGRFGFGLAGWTTRTGTPFAVSGANGLGGAGAHLVDIGTSGLGIDVDQEVDITGYRPQQLAAILDFYVRSIVDVDDTVSVHLHSLDHSGAILQTQTYGPVTPGAWSHQTLTISDLHVDTANVRVRVVMSAGGEQDGTASCAVTECILRVGQVSLQLLRNPSFEDGLAWWTPVVGAWQTLTAVPYSGLRYARPLGDLAAMLRQEVPIPAGHQFGAAVLEFARMNDAPLDQGRLTLSAVDAGGTVLAMVETPSEAITPTSVWRRGRLVLDPIPGTATRLRVEFNAVRVGAGALNTCLDDLDLRVHKHLDPDHEMEISFERPVTQPLPSTVAAWRAAFPDIPAPDYAMFDGGTLGRLGTEPLLAADVGVRTQGKAVIRTGTAVSATCYELTTRADADVHTAGLGTDFANFAAADTFTAMAFVKVDERPFRGACGIMGRIVDGRGWSLELTDDGFPRATFMGSSGTRQATFAPAIPMIDGGLHGAAFAYDAAASELHVDGPLGSASTSTSGMGEIRSATPGRFRLLRADHVQEPLPGQLVRGYLWRRYLTPAQRAAVMQYTRLDSTGEIDSYPRVGAIAVVTETDSTGVVVETFGTGQVAIGLDLTMSGSPVSTSLLTSGRRGLVAAPQVDNLAPSTFADSRWTQVGVGTVERDQGPDPTGYHRAARITSSYAEGFELGELGLGAAGTVTVAWFARADVTHDAAVVLSDDSGNDIEGASFAVTTTWRLYSSTFTWSGATGGLGRLRFAGATPGPAVATLLLCPIVFVGRTSRFPGVIPYGSASATTASCGLSGLPEQLNHEGELEVELVNVNAAGTIADLSNGANDNDRRRLWWDARVGRSDAGFDHYTGEGESAAGANEHTSIVPAMPWVVRGRWCRAGLIDAPVRFVAVRSEQGPTTEQTFGHSDTWIPSSAPLRILRLGHDGGSDVLPGLIFCVRVSSRERGS